MRGTRQARAALLLVAASAVILSLAPPLTAKEERVYFDPREDKSSWFWSLQIDEEVPPEDQVDTVCAPGGQPLPVCPQQRVRLPSPQDVDSLPVMVFNGAHDKLSAVAVDVARHGVEAGSTITKFVLSIEESSSSRDFPSFNAGGKLIEACRATDFWPTGETEVFETQPPVEESTCVNGKRIAKATPPFWTFDLTEMAEPWGISPFENYGVVLRGVLKGSGPTETWQINLKKPLTEAQAATPEAAKQSAKRIGVDLDFELPPPVETAPIPEPTDSGSTFAPSTSFAPPEVESPPASEAAPTEEAPEVAAPAPTVATGPELPGYVWALVPAGLVAFAAVKSVVLEPVGGTRKAGVIAAIRRQNAARRGVPIEESTEPFARARGALRRSATRIRGWTGKGLRAVRRG
ncbi:MAG: hypothetical protein ACRDH6_06915 [Actinomycetota bacterium]